MQDAWSASPNPPPLPSTDVPLPRPPAAPMAASPPLGHDMTGLRLVSGTGEDLGTIRGILPDRRGLPKWIEFVEDDGTLRRAPLWSVRGVGAGVVRLAGPREGYHITRLGR